MKDPLHMETLTCRERQTVEIGEDIQVTVLEVSPGIVRLDILAPGRRITQIDPIPLPVGASELRLVNLDSPPDWPHGGQK